MKTIIETSKMKTTFFSIMMIALLFACTAKTDKLPFAAFEIKDDKGIVRIAVDESGTILTEGVVIGQINHNGTVNDKDGNLLVKITDSNTLQGADGKDMGTIDATGKIDTGDGIVLEWSESGAFMKNGEKIEIQIAPVDQSSFQAASVVLLLYLGVQAAPA